MYLTVLPCTAGHDRVETDSIHLVNSKMSKDETLSMTFEEVLGVSEAPERDYNFFRDRWTTGTCQWILNDPSFIEWRQDPRGKPRILWIQGNPASGKSVLSSFIIDHLMQNDRLCQYFFVRYEDKNKRVLSTILRSLACQLACALPAYAARIRQLEAAGSELRSNDHRHIWQIMYKKSLFDLDVNSPIYWVLDGIDEADKPKLLFNTLAELSNIGMPLRILLVTRPKHDIVMAAQRLSKQIEMHQITLDGHKNKDDFRQYIDEEICSVGKESYRKPLIAEILRLAQGNFLWVHLAVQKINECHTRVEVEDALRELPAGMEALYHQMVSTIKAQPAGKDPTLGQRILTWATYSQRPLSVEELSNALGVDEFLEIHRTIGQLCGGLVVVDHEGRVALIHETAREYLVQDERAGPSLGLWKEASHDRLFTRCITQLMDPTLRDLVNRDRTPPLLDYAISATFFHLSKGSLLNGERLSALLRFFQNQHVLTWIHIAAKKKKIETLAAASRYLIEMVVKLRNTDQEGSLLHCQAIECLSRWATDLVQLVGKFRAALVKKPESIYKLVPPFCPEDSIIYQQFGKSEAEVLRISGITRYSWDDRLARLSLEGATASAVRVVGGRILVLANRQNSGYIFIYDSTTFEEERSILHPERVFKIQADSMGEKLVSYGYRTTKVWAVSNGECIKTLHNPRHRPRPQSIVFLDNPRKVLLAGEDRCVRSFNIDDDSTEFEVLVKIEEQSHEDTYTVLNFPVCSALSPDGDMIVFGYRGHPVTAWNLDTEEQVGLCKMTPGKASMTTETRTFGEIIHLEWHPFNCEVFGLHREGLMFKWNPYDDEPSITVLARAQVLAVSANGLHLATGDMADGAVRIYATADLRLLYQVLSQNPVLGIAFSADSKRIYGVGGEYADVWEPNALVQLQGSSEYADPDTNNTWMEIETPASLSLQPGGFFSGAEITSLCGQMLGPLYCYGTEDGVAVLGEVGHGNVCEVDRMGKSMSVEHISWSDDGNILAIADLSDRLCVKCVSKRASSTEYRRPWHVQDELKVVFPSSHRHINHVIFRPQTHTLLAISPTMLLKIDADTHQVEELSLPDGMANMKWICHPTQSEYLLAFGNNSVRIFSWSTLKEIAVHHYSPSRPRAAAATSGNKWSWGTLQVTEETPMKVSSCPGSPDIILEIAQPTSREQGKQQRQYLMFTMGNIDEAAAGSPEQQPKELPYTLIPPEVASRIREPLGLLSGGNFVFLDADRWICTWRTPTAPRRSMVPPRTGLVAPVDAHYFLPPDWLTGRYARLGAVTPDGTLLCPRNGEIASVQCTKLRSG